MPRVPHRSFRKYVDHSDAPVVQIKAMPISREDIFSLPFPIRLHWMLSLAEEEGYSRICSWKPHGRAFQVHKKDEFEESILPRYFNHVSRLEAFSFQSLSCLSVILFPPRLQFLLTFKESLHLVPKAAQPLLFHSDFSTS